MNMRRLAFVAALVLSFVPLGIDGANSESAGAASFNAESTLTAALAYGAHQSSMTAHGSITEGSLTLDTNIAFSPAGSIVTTGVLGTGTEYLARSASGVYFVKADSLPVLRSILMVKEPTGAEINVWYKIPASDPRYASIASPGGAQTIAQTFSFSPVGWSQKVTDGGVVTLRGTRVIKLIGASNLTVDGTGFKKQDLYVTDTAHPIPFAMSAEAGTTGDIYFSKWDATKVVMPTAKSDLPR